MICQVEREVMPCRAIALHISNSVPLLNGTFGPARLSLCNRSDRRDEIMDSFLIRNCPTRLEDS